MRIIQSENPRPLNLLAVGPNGLVAAASSTFGTTGGVEVWDVPKGTRKWYWADEYSPAFRFLAFVLDGQHILAADSSGAQLLALRESRGKGEIDDIIRLGWRTGTVGASGDRAFFARSHGAIGFEAIEGRAALTCWQVPKFTLLWKEDRWDDYTQFSAAPVVAPDGTRLALAVQVAATHPTQFVSLRDAATGKQLVRFPLDPASPVQQLAFTADGSKLLVRTDSNKVQLFDSATGASAGELAHKGRPYVTGVAMHPRGPVACARTDGTVTFWDVEKREQLRALDWKAGRLVSVAFAPDGALAAAGTEDGKIVVWDVDL